MDRSSVAWLISRTYRTDALKQRIPEEKKRKIYCNIKSVGANEFFSAGQAGIKAEYQLTMFTGDYAGEIEIELDGVRYAVYRTYRRRDDNVELYLRKAAGV